MTAIPRECIQKLNSTRNKVISEKVISQSLKIFNKHRGTDNGHLYT